MNKVMKYLVFYCALFSISALSNYKVLSKTISKSGAIVKVEVEKPIVNLNNQFKGEVLGRVLSMVPGVKFVKFISKVESGSEFPKDKKFFYRLGFQRNGVSFNAFAKIESKGLCSDTELKVDASKCKNFSYRLIAPLGVEDSHSDLMNIKKSPESFSRSFEIKASFESVDKQVDENIFKYTNVSYEIKSKSDIFIDYLSSLMKKRKIASVPTRENIIKSFANFVSKNTNTINSSIFKEL